MPITEMRKKLSGVWQRAIAVQTVGILLALVLLLASWYAVFSISRVPETFAQPYAILTTLLLCLADLLVRSPIRAGQFAFYREVAVGNTPPAAFVLEGFRRGFYRKGLSLRLRLWIKRAVYTLLALFPSAALLALGNYVKGLTTERVPVQLTYLLCCLFAAVFFVTGILGVELLLLRYMPAWQLLPDHPTAKEALKRAKKLTKSHTGELVWLYSRFMGWKLLFLLILPYFYVAPLFAAARADWIEKHRDPVE